MRILANTTSPYARIVRIALAEKGHDIEAATTWVDPWRDEACLRAYNVSSRVPAVVADSGMALTDSLLILLWLEKTQPEPSLTAGDPDPMFHRAGVALDVIDAMIDLLTHVIHYDAAYAEHPVGQRRRRTIVEGLERLDQDPPTYAQGTPDIAVITTLVALDYFRFALGDQDWRVVTPALDALRERLMARKAFARTLPYRAR